MHVFIEAWKLPHLPASGGTESLGAAGTSLPAGRLGGLAATASEGADGGGAAARPWSSGEAGGGGASVTSAGSGGGASAHSLHVL